MNTAWIECGKENRARLQNDGELQETIENTYNRSTINEGTMVRDIIAVIYAYNKIKR